MNQFPSFRITAFFPGNREKQSDIAWLKNLCMCFVVQQRCLASTFEGYPHYPKPKEYNSSKLVTAEWHTHNFSLELTIHRYVFRTWCHLKSCVWEQLREFQRGTKNTHLFPSDVHKYALSKSRSKELIKKKIIALSVHNESSFQLISSKFTKDLNTSNAPTFLGDHIKNSACLINWIKSCCTCNRNNSPGTIHLIQYAYLSSRA